MKKGPAIIASFLITLVVGAIMSLIGLNALLNPNQVAAASSPSNTNTTQATQATDSNPTVQVKQLQDLVTQYQQQLNQAKQEIKQANSQIQQSNTQAQDANTQLQQANAQLQQYEQLLTALQQAGVISIDQNGQVTVPQRSGRQRDNGGFLGGGNE